ncbi:MAG: AAA family ATPase, partial [Chloroflexi bacterium]|nr:AAA family ATPase [Chloroflexota bacterium]
MDMFARLDQVPTATPTLAALQPRLARLVPAALQRRLHLGTDPLPEPDPAALGETVRALYSLYHSLTTYVPRCLADQVTAHPTPGQPRGQFLDGTVLFADISGFTSMSEKLGQRGPAGTEELTAIVNDYFDEMLRIIAQSDGDLLKFAGDAMLVYFPAFTRGDETEADWAIRAALRMRRAMPRFQAIATSQGTFPLRMKVGLASGRFLAAQVGTAERMEFIVVGPAIQSVMAAEGAAASGQVVMDDATRQRAHANTRWQPLDNGRSALDTDQPFALDDFEIAAPSRRRAVFLPGRKAPVLLRQIAQELDRLEALAPYLAPELLFKLVAGGKQRRVESEYRATTVLFGNVIGPERFFDVLSDHEDGAPVLAAVLDQHFTPVQQIIANHGGIISRIDPYGAGSKLLVLLGAPVAHEDDPQRAVAAALAVREQMTDINTAAHYALARHGVDLPPDEPVFQQRMGITLGTTFAGEAGTQSRREYTVMGDEVNLAARLMSASSYGQILLSRRVQERGGPRFLLHALPPIRVKGKSQPIPIYEALGRRRVTPAELLPPAPLCGREPEMAVAAAALQDARTGQGRVLILAGDAGVGKTRLACEIATRATTEGLVVLWGAALGYGQAPPYDLWREILADLLQVAPGTRIVDLENKLRALGLRDDGVRLALADVLGLDPHTADEPVVATDWAESAPAAGPGLFERMARQVGATAATPASTTTALNLWAVAGERAQAAGESRLDTWDDQISALRQERTSAGLAALLERCAAQSPLLLVFEDAHWMGSLSWDLLAALARQLANWPILVLILVRPGEPAVDDRLAALAQEPHVRACQLDNLDLTATAALIRALLQVPKLPAAVASLVYARSQGNPLFAEELVHTLREQGQLSIDPATGQLIAPPDLQTIELPASVSGIILSRIDQLPPTEHQVARTAAVIGREFRPDVLAHVLDIAPAALDRCLHTLTQDRFIVELTAGPSRSLTFVHGLTQEAIYESLSLAERGALHRQIGLYLEASLADDDLLDQCETLAAHLRLGNVPDKAATYLLRAADKARGQGSYAQAADYYREALAVGDQNPTRAARAHEGLGDLHLFQAQYGPAMNAYAQALAAQPVDDELVARVQGKRGLLIPLVETDLSARADLLSGLEASIAWFQDHWRGRRA